MKNLLNKLKELEQRDFDVVKGNACNKLKEILLKPKL